MKCQVLLPTSKIDRTGLTFMIILAVFSIIANSILLFSIVRLNLSGRPTFKFCIWMCACDLFMSFVLQPLTAYVSTISNDSCTVTHIAVQCMTHGLCEFSGLMITFVAIERYCQLRNQQNVNENGRSKRAKHRIIFAIVFSFIIACLSALSSISMFLFEFHMALSAFNFSVLTIITLMYAKVIYSLNLAAGHVNLHITRVSLTVAILMGILLVCHIPSYIVYPMYLHRKYKINADITESLTVAMLFVTQLAAVNSILQVLVMIISSKEVREYVKARIYCLLECVTSTNVVDSA